MVQPGAGPGAAAKWSTYRTTMRQVLKLDSGPGVWNTTRPINCISLLWPWGAPSWNAAGGP